MPATTPSPTWLPPRDKKLPQQIAGILEQEVIAKGWPVGELIGTEDSLIERFRLSRSTLREAIRIVETHQMAAMRVGPNGGLIVVEPNSGLPRVWLTSLTRRGASREGCSDAQEVPSGVQA